MADVSVRVFDGDTGSVSTGTIEELPVLLTRPDRWVWVDVPEPDQSAALLLTRRPSGCTTRRRPTG